MTCDEILYGKLKLWQPDEGPRVNMDTVLLAAYVRLRSRIESVFVELGSATGAISLMLVLRFPQKFRILGLEIQPELEALAQRNLVENGLGERVSFRRMDLREHRRLPAESFDGLVVNPPYEEEGKGRKSPLATVSIARQGSCCALRDVFEAASWLLKRKGRFFAVFRADRMAEFLASMTGGGIEPKRLRFVHPRVGKRASLFLIEGLKGGGAGLIVEPPLFVRDANGYTPELMKAYELEGLPWPP
ncbi:MAG: methyltransferase [Synergistaceae bacterium]|jgi:tRNA1(Val) A37 N6-methylase TrmN6|nr:methyltransferase [Synergistaceae bacterium]